MRRSLPSATHQSSSTERPCKHPSTRQARSSPRRRRRRGSSPRQYFRRRPRDARLLRMAARPLHRPDAPARRTAALEPSPSRGHTARCQLLDPNLLPLPNADRCEPAGLWDFWFIVRLWIAGWLAYCFLARAGLASRRQCSWPLLHALGRLHLVHQPRAARQPGHGGPLLFLAVETFVATPDSRRAAWLAGATGLNLLRASPRSRSTHSLPQASTNRPLARRRRPLAPGWATFHRMGGRRDLRGVRAGGAAAGPFAAHLPTPSTCTRSATTWGLGPSPVVLAIALFVPSFFELPTALRIKPDNGRWDFLGGYGGVLASSWRSPAFLFRTDGGARWRTASSFSSACGVDRAQELRRAPIRLDRPAPLLNQVWTPAGPPTWCFALSSGAAFGLARLQAADRSSTTRPRLLLALMVVLLGVGILSASATVYVEPVVTVLWGFYGQGHWRPGGGRRPPGAGHAGVLRLEGCRWRRPCSGSQWSSAGFRFRGAMLRFLALRLVPPASALRRRLFVFRQRFVAGICAAMALAAAVALDSQASFGLPERRDPAAEPPVVRFLKRAAATTGSWATTA